MNFISYISWINESTNNNVTILIPGGFKPAHEGHIDLIRRYANNNNVKNVKVIIGPGVRNGITQEEAQKIAKMLLKGYKNVDIELSSYSSPVLAVYKYIETAVPGTYAMGAAEKGMGTAGYDKVLNFVKGYNEGGKYFHLKPKGVNVIEFSIDTKPVIYKGRTDEFEGTPISGTILRKDILNKDYQNFRTNYPYYDEKIIKKIWSMCESIVKESLNEKFKEDSDSIYDLGIGLKSEIEKWLATNHPKRHINWNNIGDINTIFALASAEGKNIYIEYLLSLDANIDYLDCVPLRNAAFNGHIETIILLIKKGANLEHAILKSKARTTRDNLLIIKKQLEKSVNEQLILEGGNVFDNTGPIKKENIDPTLKKFKEKLNKLFPKINFDFILLGSAGKKEVSGDIDVALSEETMIDKNGEIKYDDWQIDINNFNFVYDQIRKRARTSSEKQSKLRALVKIISLLLQTDSEISADDKNSGAGTLFCSFPQYDIKENKIGKNVQIDINIGDINWLKFSYHSESYEGNVKGLHRTQLMVALFANKGRMFKHGSGVVNKETGKYEAVTPNDALQLLNDLYNFKPEIITADIIGNFFKLHKFLIKNLDKNELYNIYDIYLKILDSTRTDIPQDIQQYWIDNQQRLNLKGTFLPEDSNLYKYKK